MLLLCEGNTRVPSGISSLHNAVTSRSLESGAVGSRAFQLHDFVIGISDTGFLDYESYQGSYLKATKQFNTHNIDLIRVHLSHI